MVSLCSLLDSSISFLFHVCHYVNYFPTLLPAPPCSFEICGKFLHFFNFQKIPQLIMLHLSLFLHFAPGSNNWFLSLTLPSYASDNVSYANKTPFKPDNVFQFYYLHSTLNTNRTNVLLKSKNTNTPKCTKIYKKNHEINK